MLLLLLLPLAAALAADRYATHVTPDTTQQAFTDGERIVTVEGPYAWLAEDGRTTPLAPWSPDPVWMGFHEGHPAQLTRDGALRVWGPDGPADTPRAAGPFAATDRWADAMVPFDTPDPMPRADRRTRLANPTMGFTPDGHVVVVSYGKVHTFDAQLRPVESRRAEARAVGPDGAFYVRDRKETRKLDPVTGATLWSVSNTRAVIPWPDGSAVSIGQDLLDARTGKPLPVRPSESCAQGTWDDGRWWCQRDRSRVPVPSADGQQELVYDAPILALRPRTGVDMLDLERFLTQGDDHVELSGRRGPTVHFDGTTWTLGPSAPAVLPYGAPGPVLDGLPVVRVDDELWQLDGTEAVQVWPASAPAGDEEGLAATWGNPYRLDVQAPGPLVDLSVRRIDGDGGLTVDAPRHASDGSAQVHLEATTARAETWTLEVRAGGYRPVQVELEVRPVVTKAAAGWAVHNPTGRKQLARHVRLPPGATALLATRPEPPVLSPAPDRDMPTPLPREPSDLLAVVGVDAGFEVWHGGTGYALAADGTVLPLISGRRRRVPVAPTVPLGGGELAVAFHPDDRMSDAVTYTPPGTHVPAARMKVGQVQSAWPMPGGFVLHTDAGPLTARGSLLQLSPGAAQRTWTTDRLCLGGWQPTGAWAQCDGGGVVTQALPVAGAASTGRVLVRRGADDPTWSVYTDDGRRAGPLFGWDTSPDVLATAASGDGSALVAWLQDGAQLQVALLGEGPIQPEDAFDPHPNGPSELARGLWIQSTHDERGRGWKVTDGAHDRGWWPTGNGEGTLQLPDGRSWRGVFENGHVVHSELRDATSLTLTEADGTTRTTLPNGDPFPYEVTVYAEAGPLREGGPRPVKDPARYGQVPKLWWVEVDPCQQQLRVAWEPPEDPTFDLVRVARVDRAARSEAVPHTAAGLAARVGPLDPVDMRPSRWALEVHTADGWVLGKSARTRIVCEVTP